MQNSYSDLIKRDLAVNWHPCMQMKDFEDFPPFEIERAKGCYLYGKGGHKILDAISSWWCKSLGHGHPRIREALIKQSEKFEHVIFANSTNELIVELSERLARMLPPLERVFYASEGSTAVEIALKMCLQAQALKGNPQKTQFAALENGYHGESAGALGVSALGLYREKYKSLLPEVDFLGPIPYINHASDPGWSQCDTHWNKILAQLEKMKGNLAGIILEPILQGAGGMQVYSPDLLVKLRNWSRENDVYLIADEILTGMGRTGKLLACEHAGIVPDLLLLSKGLTSGWLPFSAVLTSNEMYDLFYADYSEDRAFLHSNTYTGNALGAAVALETLKIFSDEDILTQVRDNEGYLLENFNEVAEKTGALENIRSIGAMVAGDLVLPPSHKGKRVGLEVYKKAMECGALLRPLGNTIYWLPPLNISKKEISELKSITIKAIEKVL